MNFRLEKKYFFDEIFFKVHLEISENRSGTILGGFRGVKLRNSSWNNLEIVKNSSNLRVTLALTAIFKNEISKKCVSKFFEMQNFTSVFLSSSKNPGESIGSGSRAFPAI